MSDIKQALLDEIEKIDRYDEAINGLGMQMLSYGEFINRNEVIEEINKHLEGCIIISPDQSQSWRDAVSFGTGIMKDGKVIRPQDFYKEQS